MAGRGRRRGWIFVFDFNLFDLFIHLISPFSGPGPWPELGPDILPRKALETSEFMCGATILEPISGPGRRRGRIFLIYLIYLIHLIYLISHFWEARGPPGVAGAIG